MSNEQDLLDQVLAGEIALTRLETSARVNQATLLLLLRECVNVCAQDHIGEAAIVIELRDATRRTLEVLTTLIDRFEHDRNEHERQKTTEN